MYKNPIFLLLGVGVFLLVNGCGAPAGEDKKTAEQEEEIKAFREQLDSLETVTLVRIRDLEAQLEGFAAEDTAALRREITYLREIQDDIVTEKDNLQVDQRQEWYAFRQTMERNISEIKKRIDRTQ